MTFGYATVQVKTLGYWGMSSFLFSFFKWFFTSPTGPTSCGFDSWPTFGMDALKWRWNFDFEQTYIGVGELVLYSLSIGNGIGWHVTFIYLVNVLILSI